MQQLLGAITGLQQGLQTSFNQLGALIQGNSGGKGGGKNSQGFGAFQGKGKGAGKTNFVPKFSFKGGRAPAGTSCFNCGLPGHMARHCPAKGQGKGVAGQTEQVCRQHARTGTCWWEQQHGPGSCRFKHVVNVPARLQGIDGIPIDTLGPLEFDETTNTYKCNEGSVAVDEILAHVSEPWSEGPAATNMGWEVLGDQPLFPRQPQ